MALATRRSKAGDLGKWLDLRTEVGRLCPFALQGNRDGAPSSPDSTRAELALVCLLAIWQLKLNRLADAFKGIPIVISVEWLKLAARFACGEVLLMSLRINAGLIFASRSVQTDHFNLICSGTNRQGD